MDLNHGLSVVIPMYNEAENAEATLSRVEEALASIRELRDRRC